MTADDVKHVIDHGARAGSRRIGANAVVARRLR